MSDIEIVETKIDSHIDAILEKPALDYSDYLTLVNEIGRQLQKAKEAKWEAEKDQRNAALMDTFKQIVANN